VARFSRTLSALTLGLCLVASVSARAEGTSDPRVTDKKERADRAMESLRYPEALQLYREAYELEASPALLYNMGRALQAMGNYPEALDKLEAFDHQAPDELKARVPKLNELIQELRGRVTEVTLHSDVAGASVVIDHEVKGTTPFAAPLRLVAGTVSVEATKEGYVPFRQKAVLAGGGTTRIEILLTPLSDNALLIVKSPVKGAHIFVDGKSLGTAPTESVVHAGKHVVVARRDGYEESKSIAVLGAGERKELTVSLAETPGILTRWWFWAGTGVLVAGGVAVTAALLIERSPDRGSIPPGQVSTALSF
jgi:hypothetical protein